MIGMKCFACFEFIERLCDYVQIAVCSLVHMLPDCLFSVFDSICDSADLSDRYLRSGRCSTSSVSPRCRFRKLLDCSKLRMQNLT